MYQCDRNSNFLFIFCMINSLCNIYCYKAENEVQQNKIYEEENKLNDNNKEVLI